MMRAWSPSWKTYLGPGESCLESMIKTDDGRLPALYQETPLAVCTSVHDTRRARRPGCLPRVPACLVVRPQDWQADEKWGVQRDEAPLRAGLSTSDVQVRLDYPQSRGRPPVPFSRVYPSRPRDGCLVGPLLPNCGYAGGRLRNRQYRHGDPDFRRKGHHGLAIIDPARRGKESRVSGYYSSRLSSHARGGLAPAGRESGQDGEGACGQAPMKSLLTCRWATRERVDESL